MALQSIYSFDAIVKSMEQSFARPLPGEDAQNEMAPYNRLNRAKALEQKPDPKLSAVLALIYPKNGMAHIALTLRNAYKGVHSRQVSFPGGKKEATDPSLQFTALRETQEELGVNPEAIAVFGALTQLYIPPSHFLVQPFVGVIQERPDFRPDPIEVQQLLETPVEMLFDPNLVKTDTIQVMNGQYTIESPYFDFFEQRVWGATAMMLSELRSMLKTNLGDA